MYEKFEVIVPSLMALKFFDITLMNHTVHGVLKAGILKWFAIPFSSGPHFVRTLHHGPTWHGS